MLEDGTILTGITIHYLRERCPEIHIPEELAIENRPEWLTQKVTLTALDRDLLRLRIQEENRYRPRGAKGPGYLVPSDGKNSPGQG